MDVLISIKPQYVDEIRKGRKGFEYRTRIFKEIEYVDRIVIYETSPVSKIIGHFDFKRFSHGTPEVIYNSTSERAGISKEDYFKYFEGREVAYALDIENFVEYKTPIPLSDIKEGMKAPQSYVYLYEFEPEY